MVLIVTWFFTKVARWTGLISVLLWGLLRSNLPECISAPHAAHVIAGKLTC